MYDVRRTGNAALCVADTAEGATPLVATAAFGYVRLRDEGYATHDMEDWVGKLRALGTAWTDAFVLFKHGGKGEGPKLAAEFAKLFGS